MANKIENLIVDTTAFINAAPLHVSELVYIYVVCC